MGTRAPDFKYVFANAVGLALSDNDCKIIFGVEEGSGPEEMYEQLAVAMTLRTTKMLAINLTAIIDHIEKTTGDEIPFDVEKHAKMLEILASTVAPSVS